jgi:hypothetical protein
MKAFALTDFDSAPTITDIPVPDPGPGQVRVRVRAAALNGIDVAVSSGQILLRRELGTGHFTQRGGRLPEQPAELRDRDAFTLVPVQVLLDPLAQHQRRRTAAGHEPGQLVLKRPLRLSLGAEPARLSSRRTATGDPVPIRPQRLAVRALRLQLEHLTLLDHLVTSSIDNEIEESTRAATMTTPLTGRSPLGSRSTASNDCRRDPGPCAPAERILRVGVGI